MGPPRPVVGLHPGQLRLTAVRLEVSRHPGITIEPKSPEHRAVLDALADFGEARGWPASTRRRVGRDVSALLDIGAIGANADQVAVNDLVGLGKRTVEFLADYGVIELDADARMNAWIERRLKLLDGAVREETRLWAETLRGRSPRPSRPRSSFTIEAYVTVLMPALTTWSGRFGSLRQVSDDDVARQLENVEGSVRRLTASAMRSLFRALRQHRLVFADPTRGLPPLVASGGAVIGIDATLRASLLSTAPRLEQRLVILLAGVHAMGSSSIRMLRLDDIDLRQRTFRVRDRARPLDPLTHEHLQSWLAYRRDRWPRSANGHLIVNDMTAGGLSPVSRNYVQELVRPLGVTPQELRVDRLAGEAQANGGDVLRLARLFGMSTPGTMRYCDEITLRGDASQ